MEFCIPRIVCLRTGDVLFLNPRQWVEPLNWSARHLGLGSFSVVSSGISLEEGVSQAHTGRWSVGTAWLRHASNTFCRANMHLLPRLHPRSNSPDAMGGTASNTRQRALLPSPGSQRELRPPPSAAREATISHLAAAVSASGSTSPCFGLSPLDSPSKGCLCVSHVTH